MTVYTVHEPPAHDDAANQTDRFVFVRDGFYFWAFLLTPLWMIWRRLWLALLIYVVAMAALQAGLWALGMSASLTFMVGFLVSLLVGLEASTIRRWTLSRRRWANLDVVAAPDRDTAERRFFNVWIARDSAPPSPASMAPAMRMTPASTDVMGLFPEPNR